MTSTWADVQQAIIVVLLGAIPVVGIAVVAVVKIYAARWVAIAQGTADAAALTAALNRGHALAISQGTPTAQIPDKVADYLATTSPDLAKSTGVLTPGASTGQLVPTIAGSARIAASIAPPPAVEGAKP
jgi:hypothetical protein